MGYYALAIASVLCTKALPIILALCLMLLPSYYAHNYAGTIGSSLIRDDTYDALLFIML